MTTVATAEKVFTLRDKRSKLWRGHENFLACRDSCIYLVEKFQKNLAEAQIFITGVDIVSASSYSFQNGFKLLVTFLR